MGESILKLFHVALAVVLLTPSLSYSQTKDKGQSSSVSGNEEGPTAFLQVQANSTPFGLISSADINLGYNLTSKLGVDAGLPIFYTRSPFSQVINKDWKTDTLLGEPYVDVHYSTTKMGAQFVSVLTGTIPVEGAVRIYSTGRFGVDWFNHIQPEKSFGRITPFVNFGISNGTINRYYMPRPYSVVRPYQTLGIMGDGEAGVSIQVIRGVQIGGSAYGLLPGGPQKIFSRLVTPGSSVVGDSNHGRFFYSAFETKGNSSIDRDNGFSAWTEVTRQRNLTLIVGGTHSVHYRYDALNVILNFDATSLFRTITGQTGK